MMQLHVCANIRNPILLNSFGPCYLQDYHVQTSKSTEIHSGFETHGEGQTKSQKMVPTKTFKKRIRPQVSS